MSFREKIMIYDGREVIVKPVTRARFDTLRLDAQRIMGLAPVKNNPLEFLEPPPLFSIEYQYAQSIMALIWPVYEFWDHGCQYVSRGVLHDLPR